MEEELNSTVVFKSNLQTVSDRTIREDREFLASVRDPFALEIMEKQRLNLTPIQRTEYKRASVHCAYALEGDYPWGTVCDKDGKEKVVCRCINVECKEFQECRGSSFDPAELNVQEENDSLSQQIEKTLHNFQIRKTETTSREEEREQGDSEALAYLYSGADNGSSVSTEDSSAGISSSEENDKESERENRDNSVQTPAENASFASFVPVEQKKIIRLDPMEQTIVNAGPGTGKTWTLIEKIKYMLTDGGVEPENILVLCFSRAAVDVIRTRLKEAADRDELPLTWYLVDVRTFDSFSTYMLAWVAENLPDLLPDNFILEYRDYDSRIETATSIFLQERDMLEEYSHVIVDEVQDLVGVRAELVLAILETLPDTCGFTLLGDSCQAIYDYLQEGHPRILTSALFYKSLFHEFKKANYFTLEENHRQGDDLENLMSPYREAILLGNAEDRFRAASALSSKIVTSDINLVHFSPAEAAQYTRNGTVGILTRTNGQALQISTWLRNEGIDHILRRRSDEGRLASWISGVIFNAKTEVLSKREFIEIFDRLYPNNTSDAKLYWEAMISSQYDITGDYYEIENLLAGLLKNARDPLLFMEPQDHAPARITVSSIHRAKGREFDTVIVLDDLFYELMKPDEENELEHKVCYVALTRSKKRLEKAHIKTQYIYIMKDQSRRCFKQGGYDHKKYLSHFEVGEPGDLDNRSFALNGKVQNDIKRDAVNGSRLKLIKSQERSNGSVIYRIVPEENEKEVLGYTTPGFCNSMESAIQRIFNNPGRIDPRYFPNRFSEIYSGGLTTCVSANGKNIDGARRFGSMYVWNGIAVEGFAQMEKDRY